MYLVTELCCRTCVEKHSGKFQPKPRLLDTVIGEPEPQYSVDDTGFYSMGTNESEFATNVESRNNFNKNTPNYGELQDEERSIPQVPREVVRSFGKNGFAFLSAVSYVGKYCFISGS